MTSSSEETLFLRALELETREARLEFLETECRDQPELLAGVKSLLASYEKSEFLESPPHAVHALRTTKQPALPMSLGPYRVVEQIARGGMGAVFLAEQTTPVQRRVAVKIIRPELDNEDIVRRFHLEQRALALMDHKNIARVLDASTTETGISYFVMEYVDGLPIHHYCRQKQLSVRDRLLLFLDCARAIQHAHQKGILHRDIKPSNVLVAEQDRKPLVKVIDFGIAKALQQADSPNILLQSMGTRLGEVLGTPQFMSPEQASLGSVSADTRSDVYSLGALLYQLLTDMPPFETQLHQSLPFDEVLRIIRQDDPLRPSQVAMKTTTSEKQYETLSTTRRQWMTLKGDLDAIVMKALEKDPSRRYQNVGELIDDVERHQDSRPILARAPSTWYMLGKFAHRRRGLLASIVVATACLLTGTCAALIQAHRAVLAEQEARADEHRAIAAEQRTEELLYTAHLKLASSSIEKNDAAAALTALDRQVPANGKADLRSFDWYALARLSRPESRTVFRNETSLYSMCLVPHTSQIAMAGADGIVKIIDPENGSVVWAKNLAAGELNCVACSPDGQVLAVTGDDGRLFFLQADSGQLKSARQAHTRQAFQAAWSKDGSFLVTCGNEPDGRVWSFPDCTLIRKIPTSRDLECLAVSSQGDIALGSEGGTVYAVHASADFNQEPRILEYVGNNRDHCIAVTFSPDGELLASGCLNGSVSLYRKTNSGFLPVRTFTASDAVCSLTFSNEQASLLIGLKNGSVESVRLDTPSEAQYSLRISNSVRGKTGAYLLSNQENGYDWGSTNIHSKMDESPRSQGQQIPTDKLGTTLRVLKVSPGFVDGYTPKGAIKVTIEFSEPVNIDRLSERIQLVRRSDPVTGIRHKLMRKTPISVDGNVVTMDLSQQSNSIEQTSKLQKIHVADVTAIRSTTELDRFFSVGGDGAVIEFRETSGQDFQILDESVIRAGFGHSGIIWAGEQSPQLISWNSTEGLGSIVLLPQFADRGMRRVLQAKNSPVSLSHSVRLIDDVMECRLVPEPTHVYSELLISPGTIHTEPIATAISRCGLQVACSFRSPINDSNAKNIVWMKDLPTGRIGTFEAESSQFHLLISPDGTLILLSNNRGLEVRHFPGGELMARQDVDHHCSSVFSPDGQQIVSVSDDGQLHIWTFSGIPSLKNIRAHDISARDVDVSPDAKTLATVGMDGILKLWRRSVLETSAEIPFDAPLEEIEFSPDGTAAIVLDDEGRLYLIDARPEDIN